MIRNEKIERSRDSGCSVTVDFGAGDRLEGVVTWLGLDSFEITTADGIERRKITDASMIFEASSPNLCGTYATTATGEELQILLGA